MPILCQQNVAACLRQKIQHRVLKNKEAMPSCCSAITLEFFLNVHGEIDDEQAGQYCESY